MAAQDITAKTVDQQVASDTLDLLDFYHRHPKFHQYFDAVLKIKSPDVIRFRGRPIRMYIWALSELDKTNKKLYKQIAYGKDPTVKKEAIGEMLNKYNFNDDLGENHYLRLRKTVDLLHSEKEAAILNSEERAEVKELHKLKEPQRTQSYLKFLNKKDNNEHAEEFSPPTRNETAEVIDKVVKDLESQAVIKTSQGVVKAQQAAGGLGSSLIKGAASLLGRGGLSALDGVTNMVAGRGASGLASVGVSAASRSLMLNPVFWGIAVVLLVLLLFIFPMLQRGSALFPPYEQTSQTISSSTDELMSLTLKGPADCLVCRILNGGEVRYQISYTYKGPSPVDVEISGPVPADLELAKAEEEGWRVDGGSFKQTGLAVAPNTPRNFNLTLKPKAGKVDFSVRDYVVTAIIIKTSNQTAASTAVTVPTENTPANTNDCNGTYLSGLYNINTNPLKNFGDPNCDFAKDKLYSLLKEKDPKEAAFWYWLVEYESSFSPLAYNSGAKDTAGAWGLFQMGRGLNGPLDHGDVVWQLQTVNAINLKNLREAQGVGFKSDKSYWHVAWPSYCNEYPSNCRNRPN